MGTRGAIGFRVNEEDKITYNHFDSYPGYLGVKMIQFVQSTRNNDELKEIAERITMVQSDSIPTPGQIEECAPFFDRGVGNQSATDWYCLLRNTQGCLDFYRDIPEGVVIKQYNNSLEGEEVILPAGLRYMIDSHDFLLDSLFCEYAYIVNVDEMTLEFYKGFNEEAGGAGRYASQIENTPNHREAKYYGVALIRSVPLNEIREIENPDEWCANLQREMYPEEEEVETSTE